MKFTFIKNIFLLLTVLCINFCFNAQNRIDSLKNVLKKAKHDTTIVTTSVQLGQAIFQNDPQGANDLWLKAIALSEKNLAVPSITAKNKNFYLRELSWALNDVGFLANRQGDIQKALEYYHKALKIQEEIQDKQGIGASLSNIGVIVQNQGDTLKALEYYNKALKIQEEISDKPAIVSSLNNLGVIYEKKKDFARAMEYYSKSLKLGEEINNQKSIARSLNNIGMVYKKQGDLAKALEYYQKSYKIQEETANTEGIAYSLNNIGMVLLLQGNLHEAQKYASRSLDSARKLGFPEGIRNAASLTKKICKQQNNFKEALAMYELETTMTDSISNITNRKASIKKQFQYEYEKKTAADSVRNMEAQKVKNAQLTAQQAQLKQERMQFWFLVSGLLFVMVGLGFVVNRFRITRKQKEIIEKQKVKVDEAFEKLREKNKEVMDSIHYARRIQSALITNEKYIEKKLNWLNGK